MYGLKCQLRNRPFWLMIFSLSLLIGMFSLAIRVFEFRLFE